MPRHLPLLAPVLAETIAATAASALTLIAVARLQRRGALQPLNTTSHWLNGEAVAAETPATWRTTGVGLLTHAAATGFWAVIYEVWLRRGATTAVDVVGKATAMAGVSALVDYRATPKRFTPGWEFVLTPPAMALAYLALGAGLAAGAGYARRPGVRR